MKNNYFIIATFVLLICFTSYSKAEEVTANADDEEMCSLEDGKEKNGCSGKESEDEIENENLPKNNKMNEKFINIDAVKRSDEEMEEALNEEQTKEQQYMKGSACSYCTYCKFCTLCDKDCPCETSSKKPNCGLCKYCKYCYLCKMGCNTICQPGGVVDRFTSYISNRLPSFNKEEVEKDINRVKSWIDDFKEEL